MLYESQIQGIGFSLLVEGIVAFNLLLDFDLIEKSENSKRVPAYMECFGPIKEYCVSSQK